MSDLVEFRLGVRPDSVAHGLPMGFADAYVYAKSLVYRDGWTFYFEQPGLFVAICHNTTDPVDRRLHVYIRRVRDVRFPITVEQTDHLALDLIVEIEDHERLEWFRKYVTGEVLSRAVFEPHTPKEHYNSPEGFEEGRRVYRRHRRFMGKAGKWR